MLSHYQHVGFFPRSGWSGTTHGQTGSTQMLFSSLNRKTLVKITFVLFILQSGKIDDDGGILFRCYSIACSPPHPLGISVCHPFRMDIFNIDIFDKSKSDYRNVLFSLSRKTYVFFEIIHLI